LAEDGRHWDYANTYSDAGLVSFRDPWLSEDESERLGNLRLQIQKFWQDKIPEDQRAHLKVECFIRYDDIIEIDEKGDDAAEFPHVFVSLKKGVPLRGSFRGKLIVPGKLQEENGAARISDSRTLVDPDLSDRVDIFPSEFRKPIR
jgi:hypothetical protein